MNRCQIDGHIIGGDKTFIIAEIGNNHNGCVNRAKLLVDVAVQAGANCVKFQMRHMEEVYRKRSLRKEGDDLGSEYVIDLLSRFELDLDEHRLLFDYCKERSITYLCTPWDQESVEVLEGFGVAAYKVSSADLTNMVLLERLAKTDKVLILSTGMSTEDEILKAVEFLDSKNVRYILLHCNSTYPAPLQDINLKFLGRLSGMCPLVGYSGHERGISVSLAAVALGAVVIERHITLDRAMEGPDHAASLTGVEFRRMVNGIREVEAALGNGEVRHVSQGEMINRESLGKSLVAKRAMTAGSIVSRDDVCVRSPGQGLSPQYFDQLIGIKIGRDLSEEDFFFESDLTGSQVGPDDYTYRRPWGLPVRYHDFKEYQSKVTPDFWEFHLSYSDLELDPRDYLDENMQYPGDLVVHAPELFSGSRLMDLASPDESYRSMSISDTQRVISITKNLKENFFKGSASPLIVANIGGFTMDQPLDRGLHYEYYERFADSIRELDLSGVELIPQTMAPFPWHFGGQRFQNLFVCPDDIVKWCDHLDLRICLDVSHSFLTSNHFSLDFYEFVSVVAPLVAHIHIGDGIGVNGEGLQIGSGEIDFVRLAEILDQKCPVASFIPEIWQGHKNGGEGFWIALKHLNGIL